MQCELDLQGYLISFDEQLINIEVNQNLQMLVTIRKRYSCAKQVLLYQYSLTQIIMFWCLKHLCFLLLYFCAPTSAHFLTHYNYDYLLVHEQALIAEPIHIRPPPIINQNYHNSKPSLISYAQLKKYQLKDTNYRAEDHNLSFSDQNMLFSMEPPQGIFSSQHIVIDNYKLLEMRKFAVSFNNPSQKIKIIVTQITTDRSEIKIERNSAPVTLYPQDLHSFNFQFYVSDFNPQYLQCAIYFFVELYDGNILAEEKVYAIKVSARINPNHLRLQALIFKSCPRYQTLVLKNYEIFQIGLRIQGDKQIETIEGKVLDGEIKLAPTKTIKILLEGKPKQLIIHTSRIDNGQLFPTLLFQSLCEDSVIIDYFNVGIIPGQRYVFQYPLTVSSTRKDNLTITSLKLVSTSHTVIFEQMPFQTNIMIPAQAKHYQIGIVRVLSRKKPEERSVFQIWLQMSTPHEELEAYQKFYYQEMRNPISAGIKRFIDLRKLTQNVSTPERFPIKNNLNLPIFLTRYYYDQQNLQLSWSAQRRKIVYPNHVLEQLFLKYIGPKEIHLSPQKHIILLQFNGNVIVPIQIVIYDKTLRCLLDNEEQKCSNIQALQFQFNKQEEVKGQQLVFRNWNPEYLPLTLSLPIQEGKQRGFNLTFQIFGPLPGEGDSIRQDEQTIDTVLESNQFMVVDIQIALLEDAVVTSYLPISVNTGYQSFEIGIVTRIQNGTIALIPQVVRFEAPFTKTIEYLNLVSTYSQNYRIESVNTNVSSIFVAIPPHGDLKTNEFVGMTVIYDPFQPELNITSQQWSIYKKQTQFNLYMKRRDFQSFCYAEITLQTSTNLKAKSIAIINRYHPPMIQPSLPLDQNRGVRGLNFVLIKRNPKPARYGQTRQVYEVVVEVTNHYSFPMKYRPFLLSEYKFNGMHNYFRQYRNIKNFNKQSVLFCLPQTMKTKYRLTTAVVKDIFGLQTHPDEYTMQLGENQEGVNQITLLPKASKNHTMKIVPNASGFDFLTELYNKKYRSCMYFSQHEVIAKLFLSELPYNILKEQGDRAFIDFIKTELYNIEHTTFFQNEKDIFLRSKTYKDECCLSEPAYSIYSFCEPLKARVNGVASEAEDKVSEQLDQTYILNPFQTHRILVQLFNPQDEFNMFMVLSNNFTFFETYQTHISIKNSQLAIHQDNFLLLLSQKEDEETWSKKMRANTLLVQLFIQDYRTEDDIIESMRSFELVNEGATDILIDHIGIDEKFYSCGIKGIEIYGLNCRDLLPQNEPKSKRKKNPQTRFLIRAKEKYNFTIKFFINPKSLASNKKAFPQTKKELLQHNIYLYDEKGYHYKLELIFKISDPHLLESLNLFSSEVRIKPVYGYIAISIISFSMISLALLKMKEEENNNCLKAQEERQKNEEDPYKRMFRLRRLGRILKQSTFFDSSINLGTKLQKRGFQKCIHKVTEDLLLSAKEVTQRELKKYFNESEESAIGGILGINHHLSMSQSISDHQALPQEPQDYVDGLEEEYSAESSSNLPEGEEVDLTDELDEDSWYDFNRELLESHSKTSVNSSEHIIEEKEKKQEFYNVFRTDVGLKKTQTPIKHLKLHKWKYQ